MTIAANLSMHSASVPVFKRQLGALLTWLDKAEAHALARKFDPDNYLQLRLSPDMLPFVSQIRIASDNSASATGQSQCEKFIVVGIAAVTHLFAQRCLGKHHRGFALRSQ